MTSNTNLKGDLESTPPHTYPDRRVTGRLGAAHARWNDYLGTAAADDSIALLNSRSLYEIANLDRSRWTIVGIEASLADNSEQVVIYAIDRSKTAAAAEAAQQEIGVMAFHLGPSTRVDQFLHEAFQRISLRLISTSTGDRQLRVDGHLELAPVE
jgi:hypothetical protein